MKLPNQCREKGKHIPNVFFAKKNVREMAVCDLLIKTTHLKLTSDLSVFLRSRKYV